MSQQRMAGSPEFKQGMQNAAKPKGQSDNYKHQGSHLIGGGAGDKPADTSNLMQYINISKSATQNTDSNFGVNVSNKYTNAAREQSNANISNNAGFSDNRITNNANFANSQADRADERNKGFAKGITDTYVNNAKDHREDNTAKATQFANQTVSKYMEMNKNNQATNVKALDEQVRKAPLADRARSDVQGLNTYGDMYSYGRNNLPNYTMPNAPKPIEKPDFGKIYDKSTEDINKMKINA